MEEAEASADLKGKKKQTGLGFLWPTGSLGPSQEEADVLEGVTLSHPEPPAGGDRVEIYLKGLGGHPGPEGSSPFKGNSDSHPPRGGERRPWRPKGQDQPRATCPLKWEGADEQTPPSTPTARHWELHTGTDLTG